MNVINESKLIEGAKKYKKFIEKFEIYPYSCYNNGKKFYYVSYQRFNKSNGMVILSESENVTDQDIVSAFKMMYNFNQIMREALDQMIPDIKKPVSVLQEMKVLLEEVESTTGLELKGNEIKNLYYMIDQVVSFPDKLIRILKEMQAIEKVVLDRKYLLREDVDRMMELNFLHCKIMYTQGREQLKAIEDARVIIGYLKGQLSDGTKDVNKKVKQLIFYLETFSEERAIRDLNRSQASFEKDEYGNKIMIGPGEEGMQEYKRIHYRAVDHILDNHIKNYLRNFQ
ncbi:hypothetical protein [Fictibacillus norfolkensis]|uniref:Uncharacterized protein n=1 Tax=Fictibacillus norfolkensis TaxID=2762233 RepID=A0ABR8SS07_9BACL|nr:hypothetical protein [Fictibacillus norfolkensis]MBD7966287.1 hypothetical protein [Fictibacillus norfolkensis]